MRRAVIFLMVSTVAAFPAHAQVTGANAQELKDISLGGEKNSSLVLELEVAPVITDGDPFTAGDSTSDYGSTTLALRYKHSLSERLTLKLGAGGSVETDLNDDSADEGGSSIFGSAKLQLGDGFREINPFVSYTAEHGFDARLSDLIGVDKYFDHKIRTGVDYKSNSWVRCAEGIRRPLSECEESTWIKVTFALERRYSDVEDRERLTPEIDVNLESSLTSGLTWYLQVNGQYRRFDKGATGRREDVRGVLYGGFNLAGLITKRFPKLGFVDTFKVGVQWLLVDSTTAGKDRNQIDVLPVFTLAKKFW